MSIQLQFFGAAGTVTGSRHVVSTTQSSILLDCGLVQGRRLDSFAANRALGFDPRAIDAVVLSHAHIDHSGALPMLVKLGYDGAIYSTAATRDLCSVMLQDAARIQRADADFIGRLIDRGADDLRRVEPLYSEEDVIAALDRFTGCEYHRHAQITPDARLSFLDAGHVLGSAISVLDLDDEGQRARVVFTGDLGRANMPILRDPEVPSGANVLIMESTYGTKVHAPLAAMDDELAAILTRTAKRGGKVVIPTFALERAQEIVMAIARLRAKRAVPLVPVYVDSPLTVKITDIFRMHPECLDAEARASIRGRASPFDFDDLHYVSEPEDSKAIDASPDPCVILSASGMCEGGRVLHHLRATMEHDENAIVIVGFQAQHTLGRRLVERRSKVRIFGIERPVRASVHVLNGFSAHAGRDELLSFAEAVRARGPLHTVVLVHGERPVQESLAAELRERGFPDVRIPQLGEAMEV